MKLDPVFLTILSDLFVNLSAGWFGAVFIVLSASKKKQAKLLLFLNIFFGTISLLLGYIFRKLGGL